MNNCQTVDLLDGDDIEGFFFQNSGMKTTYMPLSEKLEPIHYRVEKLAGVTLSWCRGTGRARWLDEKTGSSLHLGFPVEKGDEIRFCGQAIEDGQVQIWAPGCEMELVMGPRYSTLEIGVDQRLVDELGWKLPADPVTMP